MRELVRAFADRSGLRLAGHRFLGLSHLRQNLLAGLAGFTSVASRSAFSAKAGNAEVFGERHLCLRKLAQPHR